MGTTPPKKKVYSSPSRDVVAQAIALLEEHLAATVCGEGAISTIGWKKLEDGQKDVGVVR